MAIDSSVTNLGTENAQVYTLIVAKNVNRLKTALPTFKTNMDNLKANKSSLNAESQEEARVILSVCQANYTMGDLLVNPPPADSD